MPLLFKARWDSTTRRNGSLEPDAEFMEMLNSEETIRNVIAEAHTGGGFVNPQPVAMLARAVARTGAEVNIRNGIHQLEELAGGGYQLHIGTSFNNVNYHLNIGQTMAGKLYVTSISWGGLGINRDQRTNAPPP